MLFMFWSPHCCAPVLSAGRSGNGVALKAGAEWPYMRILRSSGYAAELQRAHNLEALVHPVIPKPFSLADIRKAVQETLKSREALQLGRHRPGVSPAH